MSLNLTIPVPTPSTLDLNLTNSTNFTTCDLPASFHLVYNTVNFSAYWVVTWIHFILGTPGHLILLRAFYKEYDKDTAYMYQIFSTLSEFAELQSFVMLVLTVKFLSGAEGGNQGVGWYRGSFTLMWYAAHIVHASFSLFFTLSLLLSVCMAADRIFAMTNPFLYQKIDQKLHQFVALGVCVAISLATCYVEELIFVVAPTSDDPSRYYIHIDQKLVEGVHATVLGHTRNAVRIIAIITLILMNIVLIRLYQIRVKKIHDISINTSSQEKQRREKERILHLLTLCQSFFEFVSVGVESAYYTGQYISPFFSACLSGAAAPIMDMVVELSDLVELYITFGLNRQFRKMIWKSLRCR